VLSALLTFAAKPAKKSMGCRLCGAREANQTQPDLGSSARFLCCVLFRFASAGSFYQGAAAPLAGVGKKEGWAAALSLPKTSSGIGDVGIVA